MRPIGIDLFSGVGGLGLGFEQAGFDVAAAVEVDPVHCASHKYNFPRTAIVPRSVEVLSDAAEYFGVEPPPNRRDRKSGAKKRKQIDIERERLAVRATCA